MSKIVSCSQGIILPLKSVLPGTLFFGPDGGLIEPGEIVKRADACFGTEIYWHSIQNGGDEETDYVTCVLNVEPVRRPFRQDTLSIQAGAVVVGTKSIILDVVAVATSPLGVKTVIAVGWAKMVSVNKNGTVKHGIKKECANVGAHDYEDKPTVGSIVDPLADRVSIRDLLFGKDMNRHQALFGGILAEWNIWAAEEHAKALISKCLAGGESRPEFTARRLWLNYKAPAKEGHSVEIKTTVVNVSGKTLTVQCDCISYAPDSADPVEIATGYVVLVSIDRGKPRADDPGKFAAVNHHIELATA